MVASIVPEWSEVSVTSSGTYLGMRVGPGATLADQWHDPLGNF